MIHSGECAPTSGEKGLDQMDVPSCLSVRSSSSMVGPLEFKDGPNSQMQNGGLCSREQRKRAMDGSREILRCTERLDQMDASSCVSLRSTSSMLGPIDFKDGPNSVMEKTASPVPEPVSSTRKDHSSKIWNHTVDSNTLANLQHEHKRNLQAKFQCLHNDVLRYGHSALLNHIYTELYITEDDSDVNKEHEVRQIEKTSRTQTPLETQIKCNDIFKSFHFHNKPIRSVLTKGVAGIGKTISVQKFVLDWAEGTANQDIMFIYPFAFRELNLMKEEHFSLVELLQHFKMGNPEGKHRQDVKVLFIFDGLDECRFPLDFQNNDSVFDVKSRVSLDVLLTNVIGGNLLPAALIWITSRPAAASQIPPHYIDLLTVVRGFNDLQKEEYLKKRISDQTLACSIFSHIKSSRYLFIMCHIPVFCWLLATVLEQMLSSSEGGEIPKTLTQIYIHFLLIQTKAKNDRYREGTEACSTDEDMILKLGKLAFQQLEKGNLIFYEEDLIACGIGVREAVVYSGVCSQIFREECALGQSRVYCFVHLSIQEFLAAVYVFFFCQIHNWNVLDQEGFTTADITHAALSDLHKCAINRALESENGHLDLFLRFLLGLSLESNQSLLQCLIPQIKPSYQSMETTVDYIKRKIEENSSTEKSINLFYCLNELNELSLVKDIQRYLSSDRFAKLSPAQWSALVFVLLTSEENLDVFDLKKYNKSDEGLLRLLLVVKASKIALLETCGLTKKCCKALGSAISSSSSCLRELDLSSNSIGDTGLKLLAEGVGNTESKLEKLRLSYCRITALGCSTLALQLIPKLLHLKELDLSENSLREAGIQILANGLQKQDCKLEILRLKDCRVTPNGSCALASALRSNPPHLRELDLHWNNPGDNGVEELVTVIENPLSKLQVLWLSYGLLTEKCCAALASVFRSVSADLKAVDLSGNQIGDTGVALLSDGLRSPNCKVEILRLAFCGITEKGAALLASAFVKNPTGLRELDLSENHIGDSGLEAFSQVLEKFNCRLQTLKLRESGVTAESCSALASALTLNPFHLRELNLGNNNLTDAGINSLCSVLKNQSNTIFKMELNQCGLTKRCCEALGLTLRGTSSSLRELNLGGNDLQDAGVKTLCAGLENQHCKLETLRLFNCGVTVEGCGTLATVLSGKHTVLRELDLSENNLKDTDIRELSSLLDNPDYKLKIINLY